MVLGNYGHDKQAKVKNIIILVLLFSFSCSSNPDIEWTKGGTLQKATVTDWKKANDKNKIATCADFVVNIKSAKGEKYSTIEEMKTDAINLKDCISEAIKAPEINPDQPLAEIAIMCHVVGE